MGPLFRLFFSLMLWPIFRSLVKAVTLEGVTVSVFRGHTLHRSGKTSLVGESGTAGCRFAPRGAGTAGLAARKPLKGRKNRNVFCFSS